MPPPWFYQQALPLLCAALALLSAALGLWGLWLSRRPRRLLRLRRQQGLEGERQARALLERAGYELIAAQHGGTFDVIVDGERQRFLLRGDLLVRRRSDGRLLLAEVKTGEVAPRLDHGPTRRQLLEYALAYRGQVSGVLLVAPAQGEVRAVSFPSLQPLRQARWPALLLGVLLGALLGVALK